MVLICSLTWNFHGKWIILLNLVVAVARFVTGLLELSRRLHAGRRRFSLKDTDPLSSSDFRDLPANISTMPGPPLTLRGGGREADNILPLSPPKHTSWASEEAGSVPSSR